MNRNVTITLFRSFMRWNRKPYVQKSPFTLDDHQYHFNQYLTKTPHEHVTTIKNSEEFQYYLYYIFRHATASKTSMDDAFTALKELNVLGEQLKSNYKQHCQSLNPKDLQYRVFQVGEVVRHKTDGFRGIVCGWHIVQGIQHVYVLIDSFDLLNQNNADSKATTPMIMIESYNLDIENHPSLRYIHNDQVKLLFNGYDSSLNRYVPNLDLSFRYAADCDIFRQSGNLMLSETSSSTESSSASSSAGDDAESRRLVNLISASFRTLSTVSSIAKSMRRIVEVNHVEIPPSSLSSSSQSPSPSSSSSRLSHAYSKALLPTSHHHASIPPRWILEHSKEKISFQTAAMGVMYDIIDNVVKLEELSSMHHLLSHDDKHHQVISSQRLNHSITQHRSPHDDDDYHHDNKAGIDYRQPVKSQYERMMIPTQFISTWMKSSSPSSSSDINISYSSPSLSFISSNDHHMNVYHVISSHSSTNNISIADVLDTVSSALSTYNTCMESIDTMLQLRFQAQGITYMEGLLPSPAMLGAELMTHHLPSSSPSSSSPSLSTSSSSSHDTPHDINTNLSSIDKLSSGKVKFNFGDIIKHQKFGYRGIIVGWDQRPSADVSSWEAVIGLPSGAEQPFYKVLADEDDIEESFGITHVARPYYYVAEENLVLHHHSSSSSSMKSSSSHMHAMDHISHPMKSTYLQGYDEITSSFYYPTKLSYCFPSTHSISSSPSSSSSDMIHTNDDHILSSSYHKIDKILLSLYSMNRYANYYSQLKNIESCSIEAHHQLSSQPSYLSSHAYDIRDLMILLSSSSHEQFSLILESLLYHVGNSHHHVMERKLMRQGVAYLKRMMVKEAIGCFEAILKDYDTNFIEAHNKLAVAHHNLNDHEECIRYGEQVLEYFPDHYGALVGAGLGKKVNGDIAGAKEYLERALEAHPWAAHVPAILNTLIIKSSKPSGRTRERKARSSKRDTPVA